MRNRRANAALARRRAIGLAIVAFIGERGARRHIRTDVEQDRKLWAVADLAACQDERNGEAVEIRLDVDFRRKAAARTSEGLILLPLFAPAAETWARTTVESNI